MDGLIGALLLLCFLVIMSKQKIQVKDIAIEDMQAVDDMQKKKGNYFSKN